MFYRIQRAYANSISVSSAKVEELPPGEIIQLGIGTQGFGMGWVCMSCVGRAVSFKQQTWDCPYLGCIALLRASENPSSCDTGQ